MAFLRNPVSAALLAFCTIAVASPLACGGESSTFGDGTDDAGSSGSSGTSGASGSSGDQSSGFNPGDGGTSGSNGSSGDGAACEATSAVAEKLPLTVLIALDQSGSMGDRVNPTFNNLERKWKPVTTALKAFLDSPSSAGITANLRLFPSGDNTPNNCTASTYTTPDVPATALPNAAPFAAKIIENATFRGTPTNSVLTAAATEAEAILDADANAKVIVLLVTDGDPAGCSNNSVATVEATLNGRPFPTYVIGVNDEDPARNQTLTTNLNKLATAGGTHPAFFVAIDDPAATEAAFSQAMDAIRRQSVRCELVIPPPPAGETFDKDKVNVTTTSGDTVTALTYDPECAEGGWHYDDLAAPTQVVLCPSTCATVQADPASTVNVEFGCATRGVDVN